MKQLDEAVPEGNYKKIRVMGKDFDPTKPDAYLNSFAMKRTA